MKKNFVKKLALGLALVMAVTSVPASSEAAATPGFKSSAVKVRVGQTKKYSTENSKKYSVKFKIGNKSVATIKYSAGSKAVKVTGVAEGKTTLRADFKSYKTKKTTTVKVPVTVKAEKTEVTGFAATASRTITLTGKSLNKLTQADVTVAGYNVVAFSATKTSATITLDRMMVPNTDIVVTAGGFTGTVKYNLTVANLAVVAGAFDNDRVGQTIKFSVNGEVIEVQDMLDNGYTVKFEAKDAKNVDKTAVLFNTANKGDSRYGVIAAPVVETLNDSASGVYYVKVTVSNGTTVVASPYAEITIADLDASVNSIDSYVLGNTKGFEHNSTTLYIGEQAKFTSVRATIDGVAKQQIAASVYVKSSNPEVISVDAAGQLKAETAGTATITLIYGSVTKAITFTVATTPRYVNSAIAVDATGATYSYDTVVSGSSDTPNVETLTIVVLDQYGDPMPNKDVFVASMNEKLVTVTGADALGFAKVNSSVSGSAVVNFNVQKNATGTANIVVRDKKTEAVEVQTNAKTLLTFVYNFVADDTVVHENNQLVVSKVTTNASESADAALDLYADNWATLALKGYNAAGVYVGKQPFTGWTVSTTDAEVVAVSKDNGATTGTSIALAAGETPTVHAAKAGTVTITLKKGLETKYLVVTVTNTRPSLTGVTFKAPTTVTTKNAVIDYTTFFDYTLTGKDPVISGLTTNASTTSKIRLATDGTLYLDRNDSSAYNDTVTGKPGDIYLGKVAIELVTGHTGFTANGTNSYKTTVGTTGHVKVTVYDHNGLVKATTSIKVEVPAI